VIRIFNRVSGSRSGFGGKAKNTPKKKKRKKFHNFFITACVPVDDWRIRLELGRRNLRQFLV
jgi:hypothetical protein